MTRVVSNNSSNSALPNCCASKTCLCLFILRLPKVVVCFLASIVHGQARKSNRALAHTLFLKSAASIVNHSRLITDNPKLLEDSSNSWIFLFNSLIFKLLFASLLKKTCARLAENKIYVCYFLKPFFFQLFNVLPSTAREFSRNFHLNFY